MIFPFKGLMAPVFTPFDSERGHVASEIIPPYADYLLHEQGIKGVLVNGTSGEGMSLTCQERKATVEIWACTAKLLGMTVMVQVGGACMKEVLEMAQHAEAHKVAGILCLPDLFNKPQNEKELVQYLKHVSNAAPKTPLLYYHIPSYTNVNLNMSEVFTLAVKEVPTFAGAKYTHQDLEVGAQLVCLAEKHNLRVFLGCDTIMAGACALGFDCAIATTLNMFAGPSHIIVELVKAGDTKGALAQQRILTAGIKVITQNGKWVPMMKEAMNLMTPIEMGKSRLPLEAVSSSDSQRMQEGLRMLKILE